MFKKIDGKENDVIKSLLQQFVAVSMTLRRISVCDVRAWMRALQDNHKNAVKELDNFTPKNLQSCRQKLLLTESIRMDCDLDGIHFVTLENSLNVVFLISIF